MFRPAPRAYTGIAIVVAVVFLGGAALAWAVLESRQAVRTQVIEDHLRHALVATTAVQAEVTGDLALLEVISRRRLLVDAAFEERWGDATYHLQDLRMVNPRFGSAALLDPKGTLRARDPEDPSVLGKDFSHRDYYRGVLDARRPYLSTVFTQAGIPRLKVVAFAAPIQGASGELVGILQATLPVDRFEFASGLEAPESGSVIVFDQKGEQVTSIDVGGDVSFKSTSVVAKALGGMSGARELNLSGDRGTRLAGYAPVTGLGWAVVVESPAEVAYEDVTALTWRLAAVLGLVLLGAVGAFLAITSLLRRHDRLRREASAIVASMGDAVLVTDPDSRVLWVNPALEKLAGWSSQEIRGRPTFETFRLFDERGDHVVFRPSDFVTEKGDSSAGDAKLALETKEGHRIPIHTTTAPIFDESGGELGYVIVGRDVSREREIDALKSNLVSTVSHELRTPLTMIKGFSELLLTKELSQERFEKALSEINKSADRLSRLIDDLLSVSRIESGRLGLEFMEVDLRKVIDEVLRPFSHREDRTFESEIEPLIVNADPDKVVQILTNLVSNAVKYSGDGSPIKITAHRSGGSAEIAVVDQGIGMSEAEAAIVFEKFGRVERPEVRQAGGTGLGLYITKSLVEAHGGQVWVEPGPDSTGCRFAFTLPLAEKETIVG